MAVQAPLRSSTGSIIISPSDLPISPDSPLVSSKLLPMSTSSISSTDSQPQRFQGMRNLSAQIMSPTSDIVGPSPVTSNGTETTEIEDDEVPDPNFDSNFEHRSSQLMMLKTNIPNHIRQASAEEAVSVIHAPESFHSWVSDGGNRDRLPGPDQALGIISPPASEADEKQPSPAPPPISTDVKPLRFSIESSTPQAQNLDDVLNDSARRRSSSVGGLENIPENEAELDPDEMDADYTASPHMDGDGEIGALRMALEECWTLCNTLANLSTIHRERVFNSSGTPDADEKAWKCCWKLCRLLYHSRDEASDSFGVRKNLDLCRDFCQALFDVRQRKDEVADSILRVSFELNNHLYSAQDSRNLPEAFKERTLDFYITLCHRLMKQRSELAEETDSLLRACWSLAEMLFSLRQNSRDGKAPDEELLGSAVQACWELCDIFREGWTQVRPDRGTPRPSQISFHLHQQQAQSQQPGQPQISISDTASIQSGNSRMSGSHHSKRDSFPKQMQMQMQMSERDWDRPGSVASTRKSRTSQRQQSATPVPHPPPHVPETPVTEFEDTPVSPESSSPQVPNLMVLGTSNNNSSTDLSVSSRGSAGGNTKAGRVVGPVVGVNGPPPRWPSSASNLSGYSQGSNKTSSTATTATTSEDINVTRLKTLILKAAMNAGFSRDGSTLSSSSSSTILGAGSSSTGDGSSVTASSANNISSAGTTRSLQEYVATLPAGVFGSLPAHESLLKRYKSLVADAFLTSSSLPPRGRRLSSSEAAKSVSWMMQRSNQYGFLRDLFRRVFNFPLEEAESRKVSYVVV